MTSLPPRVLNRVWAVTSTPPLRLDADRQQSRAVADLIAKAANGVALATRYRTAENSSGCGGSHQVAQARCESQCCSTGFRNQIFSSFRCNELLGELELSRERTASTSWP